MYCRFTQKAVQVFYCIPVDLGNGKSWYWAEDTGIHCYKGAHNLLAICAGAPVLLLVCLGFPTGLFVTLYRKRSCLHTHEMVARFGYFYQSYYASYAYWEVLVQVRKGLLGIISVLTRTFPDELKIYFAACVLLMAVALQTCCSPYREKKLNNMETVSLLISSFVCLLECITHNPEVGYHLNNIVTVIVVVLLVSFTAYMIFEFLLVQKRSIHDWLTEQDEYGEHTGGCVSLLRVFRRVIASKLQAKISSLRSRLIYLASFGINHWLSKPVNHPLVEQELVSITERQDSSTLLLD